MKIGVSLNLIALLGNISSQVNYVKLHNKDALGECTIVTRSNQAIYKSLNEEEEGAVITLSKLSKVAAGDTNVEIDDKSTIVELYSKNLTSLEAKIDSICTTKYESNDKSNSLSVEAESEYTEVRKIVYSGDSKNRIDVVFMGDGYMITEKEKFFNDINRLTKEMFDGPTFKSWLPLFNIWAIFVESKVSGIGYNGPLNTPFGLYRQQGQLRAILFNDDLKALDLCNLTGVEACDFPAIIANDDYYGGLGGQFIIASSSKKTGNIVLRHEMGHNFIEVGEEYDSGEVYAGVNAATSLSTIGWKSWLTGPLREEKAVARILEYPWKNLDSNYQTFTFTSDGKYKRWLLTLSITNAANSNDVEILLDNQPLTFKARNSEDREFYDFKGNVGFTLGRHTLSIRSSTLAINNKIPRMLAMVTMYEYGDETEFKSSNDVISAYPTWDINKRKTYRPNNEKCLMRNMTSDSFCNVCKEGMWAKFLNRINMIDSLVATKTKIELKLLGVGQFRQGESILNERLQIRWFLNNIALSNYNDVAVINNPSIGSWKVTVTFISSEIKSNLNGNNIETRTFKI